MCVAWNALCQFYFYFGFKFLIFLSNFREPIPYTSILPRTTCLCTEKVHVRCAIGKNFIGWDTTASCYVDFILVWDRHSSLSSAWLENLRIKCRNILSFYKWFSYHTGRRPAEGRLVEGAPSTRATTWKGLQSLL